MAKKADNTERRYIPPGPCTWCGHKPHDTTCRSTIRVGRTKPAPCPCTRPEWARRREERT